MDDTLIHTNLANFLSYNKAICEVKNALLCPALLQSRCDKNLLANFNLTTRESNLIKSLKEKYFYDFLPTTKINHLLYSLMRLLQGKYSTILITNAKRKRIDLLIKYHNLRNLPMIFYNSGGNKYQNCIEHFCLNARGLSVFEDNDKDIKCARDAGIVNIIKI
ncbi:HAD hydrolase-like protein [Helicobacter sp. 23-1044]